MEIKTTSVTREFFSHFQQEQALLQEHTDRLTDASLSGPERANLVDQCFSKISCLSNEVKDASSHLPAYDQRTCSTALKSLTEKVQAARSVSAPKRKFVFKKTAPQSIFAGETRAITQISNVPPPSHNAVNEATKVEISSPSTTNTDAQIHSTNDPTTLAISSLSSSGYILHASALRPVVSIFDINQSFVDLSISIATGRHFSTLALKGACGSLLLCGQISGAAHITGVERCSLVIWGRQVRLHECRNCVVYLQCSSKPIIEDCYGIRFAPLPNIFHSLAEEPSTVLAPNLWDQIDDFNWLRAEHSPNWSLLQPEDEEAIASEGWEKIVAAEKSQLELNALLKVGKIVR